MIADGRAAGSHTFGVLGGAQTASRLRLAALSLLILNAVVSSALASRKGPGISGDSVFYVFAARSFAATGEFTTHLGAPLGAWPPGLSAILGVGIRAGIDAERIAVTLNLVCVGLVVVLTYALANQVLRSPILALACAAITSGSASTVRVFSMLWTEPIFSVLTLLSLLVLTRAVTEKRLDSRRIWAIAAAVSAASTLRFAGAVLIPIATLGTMVVLRSEGRTRALLGGLTVGGLASIGLIVMALRNLTIGGTLTGPRGPAEHSMRSVLFASLDDLGQYAVTLHPTYTTKAGFILAIMLVAAVVHAVLRRDVDVAVLAAFTAVYWPFLWYSAVAAGVDVPNERLTAPVFTPMVVLWVYVTRLVWRAAAALNLEYTARLAAGAILTLSLITSTVTGWRYALNASRYGIGHNATASLQSPLAAALSRLPTDLGVAANDANLASWATGRAPIVQTPRLGFVYESLGYGTVEQFSAGIENGSVAYLAFFDANIRGAASAQDLIRAGVSIRLVQAFQDGSLWQPCVSTSVRDGEKNVNENSQVLC